LPVVTGLAAFDPAFLPKAIAPWVMDISDRMQCPPDFVAIPAMVALGAVIGRKLAVRPQCKTDWYEVPNLWGCIVGRPGALKSPAMDEALKPLHRLEAEAARDYEARVEFHRLQKEDAQKKARKGLKNGTADAASLIIEEPEEPKARRYVTNDATYEALGVILADNPNGTLAFRDELVSLLKTLDREEHVAARGFFLTAWNGKSGYTFDRIIRGRTHIEAACLSLLGSTQPGRLAEYMRRAISGGAGDDGMVQRFSLLVWPDQSPHWANTDRYPASEPRAGRPLLGRKGIGKFAGFGIARIVEIETVSAKTGERTVFSLDLQKLRSDEFVGESQEIDVLAAEGRVGAAPGCGQLRPRRYTNGKSRRRSGVRAS
jgi:Protein of unknown function (DUF3987)